MSIFTLKMPHVDGPGAPKQPIISYLDINKLAAILPYEETSYCKGSDVTANFTVLMDGQFVKFTGRMQDKPIGDGTFSEVADKQVVLRQYNELVRQWKILKGHYAVKDSSVGANKTGDDFRPS